MANQHASKLTNVTLPIRHLPHASKPLGTDELNEALIISPHGDLIIEYTDPATVLHRWKVSSRLLMDKSPYFEALLDPDKFAEGRLFAQQSHALNDGAHPQLKPGPDDHIESPPPSLLPKFNITPDPMIQLCGADAIELFLRIICLESHADETQVGFEDSLKSRPPAVIARLIEVADWFNSPRVIRNTLRGIGYMFGKKDRSTQGTFNPALLKMKEDRVRQNIIIAHFLQSDIFFQTMTHTLIVAGSRYWINGPERPDGEYLRWRYLPDGMEEELYYRRQCVLNTITDLHAHFLRKYGALEDIEEAKRPSSTGSSLGAAFSTSSQTRQFQCRAGLDNASQCDSFHLGQMTRFFSMRTKTIFIGSTLIDPEFNNDITSEDEASENENTKRTSSSDPPSDIAAIIASLKQYPEYQVDPNHKTCGVRRRLMPIIPCIEKYVSDPRSFLGIYREHWEQQPRLGAWRTSPQKNHAVGIQFSHITSVQFPAKSRSATTFPLKDEAWLLFTAKKRNWEA